MWLIPQIKERKIVVFKFSFSIFIACFLQHSKQAPLLGVHTVQLNANLDCTSIESLVLWDAPCIDI